MIALMSWAGHKNLGPSSAYKTVRFQVPRDRVAPGRQVISSGLRAMMPDNYSQPAAARARFADADVIELMNALAASGAVDPDITIASYCV